MNKTQKEILDIISKYATENPSQRFGQIIFNLDINQFDKNKEFIIRDIHNDSDEEILKRVKERLKKLTS
ncbi:MAG: hypothetical protein KA796_06570 [Chryseobacterium sp.]|nr:hypothetical protein [Chryseobacterium sp.]MBP7499517.1 hypothetical protein [Chryseobacterium sp.]